MISFFPIPIKSVSLEKGMVHSLWFLEEAKFTLSKGMSPCWSAIPPENNPVPKSIWTEQNGLDGFFLRYTKLRGVGEVENGSLANLSDGVG